MSQINHSDESSPPSAGVQAEGGAVAEALGAIRGAEQSSMMWVVLLGVLVVVSPACAHDPIVGTLTLDGEALRVEVEDRAKAPWQAQRMLRVALRALPHLRRVAGFPFPEERVRIEVFASKKETGNEVGYLDHVTRTIRAWQGITDWLLVHELAHYWFLDRFAQRSANEERWLIEGLCHYSAVEVCGAAQELGDPAWVHHVLIELSLKAGPQGFDPPLASWRPAFPVRDDEYARKISWYGKAYGFFRVLRSRLGADGVARINAQAVESGAPTTTEAYLALVRAASPALKDVATGWVVAGERRVGAGFALFSDGDGDGLTSAEEARLGTSDARIDSDGDGVSDGLEVRAYSTDPARRSSKPELTLRVDGRLSDWPAAAARVLDPAGDAAAGSPKAADLREARAWADEGALAVALTTEGGFAAKGVLWGFGVDEDGDDVFDAVFGFDAAKRPWAGRPLARLADTDWHPNLVARLAVSGNTAELLLPSAALGSGGTVRILPYSASGDPLERVDAVGWLTVKLPGSVLAIPPARGR